VELDYGKAALIIIVTIILVAAVNAIIYLSLRRRDQIGQIDLFKRAAGGARQPWAREDSDLEELSRRVAELKQKPNEDPKDE
jgi:hypothetical protein